MKRFFLFSLSWVAIASFLVEAAGSASIFTPSRRLSGFSADSRHYIYLESYRNSVTDVPTAQIQIVNVATNSCVRNGCVVTDYDRSSANLSNQAAENDLLQQTTRLRQNLRLNQLKVGRVLPIIARTTSPANSDIVQVRVNEQSPPLQISLQQRYLPPNSPGGNITLERASMRLVINYNNRQLTIGNLNNYRDAVRNYSIREVRLSPDGRNVVVLITMTRPTYEGVVRSTLVQSFPLWS